MPTPEQGSVLSAALEFFEEDEWPFNLLEEESVISIVFQGENGQYACFAKAREDSNQFIFYTVCPINAPTNRRRDAAEFLARANHGLIIGNFEMDFDDGEIRYKTSIDVEDNGLNSALIKPLVYANILTMDQYLPGIAAVIYSDTAPAEAITGVRVRP